VLALPLLAVRKVFAAARNLTKAWRCDSRGPCLEMLCAKRLVLDWPLYVSKRLRSNWFVVHTHVHVFACRRTSALTRRLLHVCSWQTDAAAVRLRELLQSKSDVVGIRVGVRKRKDPPAQCRCAWHTRSLTACRVFLSSCLTGGCSGNTYVMDYANEKGDFDEEVTEKGVCVAVHGVSAGLCAVHAFTFACVRQV